LVLEPGSACVGQRAHDAGAHGICMGPGPLGGGRRPSRVPPRSLDARFGPPRAVTGNRAPIEIVSFIGS
jgi:hypothetical protein